MKIKKTVLITNDDGFESPGIRSLYKVLNKEEYSLFVTAPETEQSGVGHSFTFNKPIHYEKKIFTDAFYGYQVSGSPSDCVKFAISYLMDHRPDLILSGINNGENSGLSAFYSGTVAAAREGAFWGIPSFAFSVCRESFEYLDEYALLIPDIISRIEALFDKNRDFRNTFFNINFPPCPVQSVKGIKITWQSMAYFDDRYEKIEVKSHKSGEGFLVYGEKKELEQFDSFDSRALLSNYITVTPLNYDSTSYTVIPHLQMLEGDFFFKR
jgi:5'-nucleotidase